MTELDSWDDLIAMGMGERGAVDFLPATPPPDRVARLGELVADALGYVQAALTAHSQAATAVAVERLADLAEQARTS